MQNLSQAVGSSGFVLQQQKMRVCCHCCCRSTITLGIAQLSSFQQSGIASDASALQEYKRRLDWETGNMDYMGKDSFDNIWAKICQTIEEKDTEEKETSCGTTKQTDSTAPQNAPKTDESPKAAENLPSSSPNPPDPLCIEVLPSETAPQSAEVDDIIFSKPENRALILGDIKEEEELMAPLPTMTASETAIYVAKVPEKTTVEQSKVAEDKSAGASQVSSTAVKLSDILKPQETEKIAPDTEKKESDVVKPEPIQLKEEKSVAVSESKLDEGKEKLSAAQVVEKPSEPPTEQMSIQGETQVPVEKSGGSDSQKDEGKQKKGVLSKILEIVGVAPKGKNETNGDSTSNSVFYDVENASPSVTQTKTEEPPKTTEEHQKATEEPKKATEEPKKTTEGPQKVTEEPKKATEEPKKTTEGPQKATEEPKKTTEGPQKVTEEPKKATEEPQKVTEEPKKATEEPQKATEEPKKTTEGPQKVTEEPKKTTEGPQKVTEEPKKGTEEPKKATEEPPKKTEEPKRTTEGPQKVTEEPKKATEEPKKATEEPKKTTEEDKSQKKETASATPLKEAPKESEIPKPSAEKESTVKPEAEIKTVEKVSEKKKEKQLETISKSQEADKGKSSSVETKQNESSIFQAPQQNIPLSQASGKKKSPSPKLSIPAKLEEPPKTAVITATPPVVSDVPAQAKNSALLTVDEKILDTPTEFSAKAETFGSLPEKSEGGDQKKVKSEIEDIIGKAKSEVDSQLQVLERETAGTVEPSQGGATDLVNTMKLIAGSEDSKEKQPKPQREAGGGKGKRKSKGDITPMAKPEGVEELKVTPPEEREKHKGEVTSSKLSDQILKAIPPPRRKAISESKTETASSAGVPSADSAEAAAPEEKSEEPAGEKPPEGSKPSGGKAGKSSSIPVPPPRNKPKPPQTTQPKGKTKK